MATTTKETKEKLQFLQENFKEEDYQEYLKGNIKYIELCNKYDCSDYIMCTFFKQTNRIKRQKNIKTALKENIFDSIDSRESAYIFGFYMADGCISKDNVFIICINEKDLEILTKIKDYISPNTKLNYKKLYTNKKTGITTKPMYCLRIKSKHISEVLNLYGCGFNKTYLEKSIKKIVPKEYMWDFIRGYFDGDGCISSSNISKKHILSTGEEKRYYYTNRVFKITSQTKLILDEIQEFMFSEEINTSVHPDSSAFEITCNNLKGLKSIYKKIYTESDLYMERKRSKFKEIIENTEVITENKESVTP